MDSRPQQVVMDDERNCQASQELDGEEEDEISKLRSDGSTSPSTISTASSGSPLVRNLSGASNKRPAPTSIAAAQLKCQQQQLEFTNRLINQGVGPKRSGRRQQKQQQKQQQQHSQTYAASNWSQPGFPSDKPGWLDINNKSETASNSGTEKSSTNNKHSDDNKSFGYNVAKSIAFKAYR